MNIRNLAVSILGALSLGGFALAQPTFFIESSDYNGGTRLIDPNDDQAWQTAVGNSFNEYDFESHASNDLISTITVGSITVDFTIPPIDSNTPYVASLNWDLGGAGGMADGTFSGNGLVIDGAYVTLEFSTPVRGFGTWIFDDSAQSQTYNISAIEVGGTEYFGGGTLDAGNPENALMVEGFIGVSSSVGITSVTLTHNNGGAWELDNLQVGTAVPEPSVAALLGGLFAFGFVALRRRR